MAGGAVLLVALPIVLALLLHRSGSGPAAAPPPPPPPAAEFPVPPVGATVYSRQLGSEALALGVVPKRGAVLLQASVVDGEGSGVSGLRVDFAVGHASRTAKPCGAGCYQATVATRGRPYSVQVKVRNVVWSIPQPVDWPPPDGSALLANAERAWRALKTLAFSEDIASDPVHKVSSTWVVKAPDRLTYKVKGGWSAIIVGDRRWDRPPNGGRWRPSPQSPIRQPVPPWAAVTDAHILGSETMRGRPVWKLSFFDTRSHAWFTLAIDKQNLRTLDIHMTATAHFMHDAYSGFNRPVTIRPPR
jgi:hypothetical protein